MTVPRLAAAGRFHPAHLFRPAAIAILGAETEAGAQILANLAIGGFKGPIHTAMNAGQVPHGVHLAVLALPEDVIGDAMTALAERGCYAAIVPDSCPDLAAHAARTGVRALGPHSFGLAVPDFGLNACRTHIAPPSGRLALISQSAALSRSVIDWAGPNSVGFSHIVGLGGNADIGFGLTLDWLSRDSGTGAILLDIRRIKSHRAFLSAARAAARLRPVVALRAGLRLLDPDGAADRAFEAALRRAGVLSVSSFEDLLAAAETLSRTHPVRHDTVAIVSNAIGPARLAADAALREGLALPPDEPRTVPSADLARQAFGLAAQPGLGSVLVVHAPSGVADDAAIAALCTRPPTAKAALLVCAMGATTGALHRSALGRAGIAVFATPERAVLGLRHLVRDRRNREAARELPTSTVLAFAPGRAWAGRVMQQARARGRLRLPPDEALQVLAAYGIPTAPTRVVATLQDAEAAAAALGYPVVVKPRDDRAPVDRLGEGLAFDLHDGAAVTAAASMLASRLARHGAATELLVQRQAGRGRELAVQVEDDATFGPVISFGGGGTRARAAEQAADLPPLNLALAQALVARSAVGLQQRLRDHPPAATEAVAEVLVRISQLIVDFPEIAALHVPSLFADEVGVLAVDAWIRLRDPLAPNPGLAIAPYPVELIERAMIAGERITVRPIRPEDAAAHTAFFARLSPQDIRFRFFAAMRALSAEQTARLTQIDYDREMAFVAVREASQQTVGVARLVRDQDGRSGEFAIIVQPDVKGRGLAARLMQCLIDWARRCDMMEISGEVLADNPAMLAFVRHLGFSVRRMPEEPDVMAVSLTL